MIIANQKHKRRIETFARIQKTFAKAIYRNDAIAPRRWLEDRGLSVEVSGAGFSSGQIHMKKDEAFISDLQDIRFIRPNNIKDKYGREGYLVFANYGITFPLRDVKGNVVNYFGVPLRWKQKHVSFLNDDGIYPAYPHEMTTRLFISTSIVDTVTLLEAKLLNNRDSVICIPNGILLPQHEEAIKRLTELQSIIWIQSPEVKTEKPLEGRVMPEGYVTKTKKKL